MRHAILEADRVGNKIRSERIELEGQVVDGWKRLMSTLLQTPLSITQRGVVAEVIHSLEGWIKDRNANSFEPKVELADLRPSEFNCVEVIECALDAVRKSADETGARLQAVAGNLPKRAYGNAQQIHQLITLLAGSLSEICRPDHLDVAVSFDAKHNGTAELLVSLLVASNCSAENLCRRLQTLTEVSTTLGTLRRARPELTLSSGWQLALALGGSPTIETVGDGEVRVQISVPLQTSSSPAAGRGDLLGVNGDTSRS
jgi:hypothetical protein